MKILLLGSGELGKEFTIAAQRISKLSLWTVTKMLQQCKLPMILKSSICGDALDKIVAKHQPDFIVPEIEAIRTERFMITRSKESL
jgi:phosphoribosylglycinamide formyltransferase 2